MKKTKKNRHPPRDTEVAAMAARGGKGPHRDRRRESSQKACRGKVSEN